ncbi:hypothetical protein DFH09DRAFT_1340002 [Mycena vulgaris]|nr:hypothetical protein DFH09DRAFT_1340002 [Mycena vulgaris]
MDSPPPSTAQSAPQSTTDVGGSAPLSGVSHLPLLLPPSTEDDPSQQSTEFTSKSAVTDGGSAPYVGAFFPSSQKLLVAGGVFTSNITNNITEAPALPSGVSQALWSQDSQFSAADRHLKLLSRSSLIGARYEAWIRRSTGQLSLDIMGNGFMPFYATSQLPTTNGILTFEDSNLETNTIDSLTLEHYHDICSTRLGRSHQLSTFSQDPVKLGAILSFSSEQLVEIARLPNPAVQYGSWRAYPHVASEPAIEGWTRFRSCVLSNVCIYAYAHIPQSYRSFWLAQANHIFSHLRVTSKHEYYVFIHMVLFYLEISTMKENIPEGYLFLCRMEDVGSGQCSVRWPDCPAYWSLDASGAERLTTEKATELGFPAIELQVWALGPSWDESVYAGLRTFHRGKGFDPQSLDIARHLSFPLFQFTSQPVDEDDSAKEDDEAAARENEESSSVFDASGEYNYLHCTLQIVS